MNFITGATGFLGSTIAKNLIDKGEKVVAIKRKESKLGLLGTYAQQIIWKEGDINDIPFLEDAMEGCNYVYHCAAQISIEAKDKMRMQKINIEGTANVVNVSLFHQIKKLIYISSVAALPAIENKVINEESVWYTKPFPSHYGLTKFMGEMEIQRGMAEGLNCIILHPSSILGRCDWANGPGLFFTKTYDGLSFYTLGTGGFVDVKDVANIAVRCMEDTNINNERFIVSADNMSYKNLFEQIATEMGKPKPTRGVGPILSKLAIWTDYMGHAIGGKTRIATDESMRIASLKTNYSNAKVCERLNYQFVPLAQTIQETVAFFLEDKKLAKK